MSNYGGIPPTHANHCRSRPRGELSSVAVDPLTHLGDSATST